MLLQDEEDVRVEDLSQEIHRACEIEGCGGFGERHHILSRKAFGSLAERPENYIFLCRLHHAQVHILGTHTFAKRYGLEERFEEARRAVFG